MTVKLSCNSNTVLIINQLLQSMEIRPLPRTHISSITLTSRRKNISQKNFCDLMSGLSGWKILYNLHINTRSNTMFCYHSISYKPNLFLLKAVVIRWLTHAIISIHFFWIATFPDTLEEKKLQEYFEIFYYYSYVRADYFYF